MKIENNMGLMQGQDMLKAHKDQKAEESFGRILENTQLDKDGEQLKEACREMEAYFIQELYKVMRTSTQLGEGIITKGQHEEIFEDMLIEEQSKQATKAGGIGLADMLYKQLSKEQASQQYQAAQQAVDIKSPLER
ncbi:MAG TPA: hypothetical protein GX707_12700 [Epulopiscium sp.]|nr:hypothetical protein [Candidatus Epulonipiscium sp.]